MGGCEVRDLPQVENSRRILVKPFRGNVVKYKCRTHYRLFGQNMFHCADGGKWGGGEAPVCTRKFCWKKISSAFLYHYRRNFQNFVQKLWGPPFSLIHQYNFNSNIYCTRAITVLYIVEQFIMQVKKGVKQRSKIKNKPWFIVQSALYYKKLFWSSKSAVDDWERFLFKSGL